MNFSCRKCPKFHARLMKSPDRIVACCECSWHFMMKMIDPDASEKDRIDTLEATADSFEQSARETVVKHQRKECVFYAEWILEKWNR